MKKLLWIVVLVMSILLITVFSLGGCKTAEEPAEEMVEKTAEVEEATEEEPAVEPVTLNILCEGGGVQLQKAIAEKFEEETGNTVNLIEVPYAEVYDKLSAEMASGGSSYDIVTIDVIWIPTFAQFAEPLDDLFTNDVINDIFPSLVADAQFEGKYVGMPAWANAEILFYQKSLFEDLEEQANFEAEYGYELAVPKTWEEFNDIAKFFTRDNDNDGEIDLYGTDVKGAVETEWLASVLQAGSPGVVLDADGNIIIDNQAHKDALQFEVDLLEQGVCPKNVNEIDWNISQQLFWEGKLAMERFWAHNYRFTPEDSVVYGNVGVAPMIGGPGGVGAIPGPWYNIIPTTSVNKDVAKQFVQFAYENNALGLDAPLGLAARISAYELYADKAGFEHFGPLIETLNAPQTIGRPMVTYWNEIVNDVLTPMLQKAYSGEPIDDVLAEARSLIEQMQ